MKTPPDDYKEHDDNFCSNIDGAINQNVVSDLKHGDFVAGYPGWDFFAAVWCEGGMFYAMVKQYHSHVATFEDESPEKLREQVCESYGYN